MKTIRHLIDSQVGRLILTQRSATPVWVLVLWRGFFFISFSTSINSNCAFMLCNCTFQKLFVLHWWGWKCQGSMYFCYNFLIHYHILKVPVYQYDKMGKLYLQTTHTLQVFIGNCSIWYFFRNGQWSVRQKSWPSKVSLFLENLNVRDVWNGGKPALEVKARGNWWNGKKKRGRRIGREKR